MHAVGRMYNAVVQVDMLRCNHPLLVTEAISAQCTFTQQSSLASCVSRSYQYHWVLHAAAGLPGDVLFQKLCPGTADGCTSAGKQHAPLLAPAVTSVMWTIALQVMPQQWSARFRGRNAASTHAICGRQQLGVVYASQSLFLLSPYATAAATCLARSTEVIWLQSVQAAATVHAHAQQAASCMRQAPCSQADCLPSGKIWQTASPAYRAYHTSHNGQCLHNRIAIITT